MPSSASATRARRYSAGLTVLLSLAGACGPAVGRTEATPRALTGEGVLAAMHDRYADAWYRTLTFEQRTTVTPAQGGPDRVTTYHESMAIPGRLRIDTDLQRGNGQLFANDSQYVVVGNTVRRAAPGHNVLLVLGFDVYGQPAARTAAIVRELGFPLSPVREDTWEGRAVYVIGGAPGDFKSSQIWIDKERLVFVRLLQPLPTDSTKTFDARFEGYVQVRRAWLALTVRLFTDGKQTLLEEYEKVNTERTLPPELFDPRRWGSAPHWAKR